MSVYTTVTPDELSLWLADYNVGTLTDLCAFAAEMFNHRSARSALQRSEREHAAPVMGEEELEQAAAQPAYTVVEHQVEGFGVRWPLRM